MSSESQLREILSDLEGIRDEHPRQYFEILNDLIEFLFSKQ